ncbi:MAG: hypothetical protein A3E87_04890 [Gammaproteobacteria bacterium RIFCSPHIGHO2_12_FULL_35_23]|nr:MAG: hypothetical protein A3E87_04890 [Gammaproteobacteria bacterium RIFCSPHIGHO2_12_FULL_35_23]
MKTMLNTKVIWLSHVLDTNTPLFAGQKGIEITPEKSICKGDSCNTVKLTLSNHAGTHVDAPKHFLKNGETIDAYSAQDWVFQCPQLLKVKCRQADIIDSSFLQGIESLDSNMDLLFFKTGYEQYRQEEIYWSRSPGFSPELADFLHKKFPKLKAVGMDCLSLTSFCHRELGREAHKAFLSKGLRIFEDVSLQEFNNNVLLVVALPLRFVAGDGAPCTLIGWIEEVE